MSKVVAHLCVRGVDQGVCTYGTFHTLFHGKPKESKLRNSHMQPATPASVLSSSPEVHFNDVKMGQCSSIAQAASALSSPNNFETATPLDVSTEGLRP
jgi:hypothetical protein